MKTKVVIRNPHKFVFKNLLQLHNIKMIQQDSLGDNNTVLLIDGEEDSINSMIDDYKVQTGHVLIWKKT